MRGQRTLLRPYSQPLLARADQRARSIPNHPTRRQHAPFPSSLESRRHAGWVDLHGIVATKFCVSSFPSAASVPRAVPAEFSHHRHAGIPRSAVAVACGVIAATAMPCLFSIITCPAWQRPDACPSDCRASGAIHIRGRGVRLAAALLAVEHRHVPHRRVNRQPNPPADQHVVRSRAPSSAGRTSPSRPLAAAAPATASQALSSAGHWPRRDCRTHPTAAPAHVSAVSGSDIAVAKAVPAPPGAHR